MREYQYYKVQFEQEAILENHSAKFKINYVMLRYMTKQLRIHLCFIYFSIDDAVLVLYFILEQLQNSLN